MRPIVFPRRRWIATAMACGAAHMIGLGRPGFGQSTLSPAPANSTGAAVTADHSGRGGGAAHNAVGALSIDSLPGTIIHVSTADQLTHALANAKAGHHIVLASGTYAGSFSLNGNGTQTNPIVVRSADPHQATVNGSITLTGEWGIVSRLSATGIAATGNNCRISRCYLGSNGIYVAAPGNGVTLDYNEVRNYADRGIWCRPSAAASEMMNIWIHHNYIKDGTNTANTTALNFAGGAWAATPKVHNALVEYNLAEGCFSTTTIGTKCSGNTYRFNTCRDNVEGFASRHGHSNTWIGNACINSNGYQICGKGHLLVGNYTDASSENWRDIGLFWGNTTSDDLLQWLDEDPNESPYERAEDCLVIGNVGSIRVGAGSSSWSVAALNNEIRAHTGTVVLVADRHSGTIDKRNDSPGIEVPRYVILQSSDVGPGAP